MAAPGVSKAGKPGWLRALGVVTSVLLTLASASADAAPFEVPAVTVSTGAEGESYSNSLQILILMTALTLLPSIVIMMTAFTRIIVVFAILRQALGLQQTPSNQVLVGIALFLTLFVMAPVLREVNEIAVEPYLAEQLEAGAALEAAIGPVRGFMLAQTREDDLSLFLRMSETPAPADPSEVDLLVLIPAFVTSELKTAFQIGFMLFIPFLVIDMVVASVLMSMGMMMLSPLIISLPFKIMLFVMIDGWVLIMGTVASSFAAPI